MHLRSLAMGLFVLTGLVPCQQTFTQSAPIAVAAPVASVPAAVPAPAYVPVVPETLLLEDVCFYVRLASWNDLKAAYGGTALSEVLAEGSGRFLGALGQPCQKYVMDLVRQVAPEGGLERKAFMDNVDRAGEQILRHGIIFALSLNLDDEDTGFQFTFIFPHAGKDGAVSPVQKFLDTARGVSTMKRTQVEQGQRSITLLEVPSSFDSTWAYWSEDDHFLVHFSARSPAVFLGQLQRKPAGNLTHNDLFRKLAMGRTYPPLLSGFVDIRALADQWLDSTQSVLKDLGVDEVQGLTFSHGFEGRAWRESYALYLEPQRRGIWQLLQAADKLNVDQLPAMPEGAAHVWSMAVKPGSLPQITSTIAGPLQASLASVSAWSETPIVKKVLGTLGTQVVSWDTWTDPIVFDPQAAMAIQVKDAAGLHDILHGLERVQKFQALLQGVTDSDTKWPSLKKHLHGGVEYWTLQWENEVDASFVVHDGWLVLGLDPQATKDYIDRTRNKMPRWQPPVEMRRAGTALERDEQCVSGRELRILAMGVQSPSATADAWFSCWLGGLVCLPLPLGNLDAVHVPDAEDVARQLFANVSFVVDDGRALRWESYSSLPVVLSPKSVISFTMTCFLQTVNKEGPFPLPRTAPQSMTAPAPVDKSHDDRIRTVYVPMMQNKSLVNGTIEFYLTRAVIDEIQLKTPFRVVSSRDQADAELLGTILTRNKAVIIMNQIGEDREVPSNLVVEMTWRVRGESVKQYDVLLGRVGVPESPGSGAARSWNIESAAKQIVHMLEKNR